MSVSPRLPPLFTGEWVPNQTDPFDKAVSRAIAGVDSGTIFYSDAVDVLRAALVLAPETPLEEAVQAVYVAQIGLAESLGAVKMRVPLQNLQKSKPLHKLLVCEWTLVAGELQERPVRCVRARMV